MLKPREDQFIWMEKYRPRTVEETILPDSLKKNLKAFIARGDVVNLLLYGPPGVGKTTIARAILDDMGMEYIFINSSKERSIDMLRNTVTEFATSVSFNGKRKFVILDEADGLSVVAQPALKALMEEVASNCGFILTANHINKVIPPLRSRCHEVAFVITKEDRQELLKQTITRIVEIFKHEKIDVDKKTLEIIAAVTKRYYPNIRSLLTTLQTKTAEGNLDVGILSKLSDDRYSTLIDYLRGREFKMMRQWVVENADTDFTMLLTELYDELSKSVTPDSLPQLILIMNKYDYQNSFVTNRELNIIAMMTELMADLNFGSKS